MNDLYININKVAEVKGLKSTRSLRMAINKGKYKARTIPVNGGYSYEILYSSLEPEVQEKLEDEEMRSTALVPIIDSKPTFISESARMTSLARADIVAALENIKNKYKTKKEAEFVFLDLYNSGMLLPQVYKFIGKISKGYNNNQIARKMGLTLSNTKLQKWRLYCYLGEIHTAIDAVYMGLQMGLISKDILSEPMREEIYGDDTKQTAQIFYYPEREQQQLMYV